ncbi:MAG: BfmA/BtgA family mobilization protein [Candidatus Caldarchaeum sp.]
MTTVKVSQQTIEELQKLKQHFRETYEDVIKRLIEFYKANKT